MVQITSKPAVTIPADNYNAVAKSESHISGEEVGRATVVVKRQAEEVGKRAPDKLRAQENHKLKLRARLKKRVRKQKARIQSNQTTVKLKLSSQASELYSLSL